MAMLARNVLPGFRLSLGYTLTYLSLLVLIPLGACFLKTASLSWQQFWEAVWTPQARAAYELTFGASLAAACLNLVVGLLIAWVLTRYDFPLKRFFDAIVDLPFALPTAVAGLVYANLFREEGWYGQFLVPLGIEGYKTRLGIVLVLTFTGLPFVVRTVQPVLENIDAELEEAAAMLGATRWQTFRRVIFPLLLPALLTGFALSFARALGEYGSVVFISGNLPFNTEIAPVLIFFKLEQFQYAQATALAVVLLLFSFVVLVMVNFLQRWSQKDAG